MRNKLSHQVRQRRSHKRFKETLFLLWVCGLLAGCATDPGHVTNNKSVFDGSTEVKVAPAWVVDGLNGGFRVGLHRNSNMPTNVVILTAVARGPVIIPPGPSLRFNIDGDIVALKSSEEPSRIIYELGGQWATMRYKTDVQFIRRMVEGTNVTGRLELEGQYVEGKFSTDAPTTARRAFRKFLAQLDPPK